MNHVSFSSGIPKTSSLQYSSTRPSRARCAWLKGHLQSEKPPLSALPRLLLMITLAACAGLAGAARASDCAFTPAPANSASERGRRRRLSAGAEGMRRRRRTQSGCDPRDDDRWPEGCARGRPGDADHAARACGVLDLPRGKRGRTQRDPHGPRNPRIGSSPWPRPSRLSSECGAHAWRGPRRFRHRRPLPKP